MERAELARAIGGEAPAACPATTIIEARAPDAFMDAFRAAAAGTGTVLVADPAWGAAERARFAALAAQAPAAGAEPGGRLGWLALPTGGTSGGFRLARHDHATLAAAVEGCRGHFGLAAINAVGVLPMHHVSGLMAWLRCALTGGRYQPWAWHDLAAGRWPDVGAGAWVLSVVPTQLERLLDHGASADRLRRYRAVFLGGGPAWPELLERARAAKVPLAPGYGMTETAAMVAALRPEEFLAGESGSGTALPHARVDIDSDGAIRISAESLFRGYFPDRREPGAWTTGDLGRLDGRGGLHVLGRRDAAIITGGEKVDPAAVEAVLRATGEFTDVAVVGVPDPEWGQCVVACYPPGAREPDLVALRHLLQDALAPAGRPKHFVRADPWPRTEAGKVNRRALGDMAAAAIGRSATGRL